MSRDIRGSFFCIKSNSYNVHCIPSLPDPSLSSMQPYIRRFKTINKNALRLFTVKKREAETSLFHFYLRCLCVFFRSLQFCLMIAFIFSVFFVVPSSAMRAVRTSGAAAAPRTTAFAFCLAHYCRRRHSDDDKHGYYDYRYLSSSHVILSSFFQIIFLFRQNSACLYCKARLPR